MIAGTIVLSTIGVMPNNLGARARSLMQEPISPSQPIDLSMIDGSLMHAKELYWSAAFDEALTVLQPLKIDGSSTRGIEVGMYRTLCLLALKRLEEADEAVQSIVRENPLYRPSEEEITPRARILFYDVRRRLLPSIAREAYERANEALDRGAPEARNLVDRLFALLNDPDVAGLAELTTLRTSAERSRERIQAEEVPKNTEADSIRRVVDQYVNALNSLDEQAALTIWPSLDERALARAFSQLVEQELRLDACLVDRAGPRAAVSCHGRLRYLPKIGSQTSRTREGRWTFRLRNTAETWTIESVAIR
jgi:hypothetical protein